MKRWRRPGADEILLVFLVLAAADFPLGSASHTFQGHPSGFWFTALLAWRVARGNRLARLILVISSEISCAHALLAVARQYDRAVMALVVIDLIQVLLVTSAPVFWRTRHPVPVQVRLPGWERLLRLPPAWLLPLALLAGGVVTAAYLGHMDLVAVPGCRPASSDACTALAEGYPLHWLSAAQNTPMIAKRALFRDFVQWSLASTSALYLAWLWLTAPAGPPERLTAAGPAEQTGPYEGVAAPSTGQR